LEHGRILIVVVIGLVTLALLLQCDIYLLEPDKSRALVNFFFHFYNTHVIYISSFQSSFLL
jgi:hypothetical protein